MSSWCSKCDFQECGPLGVHKCYCGHFRRDHVCDEPENAKPRAVPPTPAQLEANRGKVISLEDLKKDTSPESGADQGVCPTCNKIFGWEAVLVVNGARVHKACASAKVCAKCKGPVAGAYVGSGGQYFHKECAGLTGICPGCNQTLSGQMVTVAGKKYHSSCLNCAGCKKNVVNGFLQHGELFYCEPCYEPFLETVVETTTTYTEEETVMSKFEEKYSKWTTALFGGGQPSPSSSNASSKWTFTKPVVTLSKDDAKEKEKKAAEKAAREAEMREKMNKDKEAKDKALKEKAEAKERENAIKEKEKAEKLASKEAKTKSISPTAVLPTSPSLALFAPPRSSLPTSPPLSPTAPPRSGPSIPPQRLPAAAMSARMALPPRTGPSPVSTPTVPLTPASPSSSPPPRALSPSPPVRSPAAPDPRAPGRASQSQRVVMPPPRAKSPKPQAQSDDSEDADRRIVTFLFGEEVKKIRLPPLTVKLPALHTKLLKAFPVEALALSYMQGGTQVDIINDDILFTALTTADVIMCVAAPSTGDPISPKPRVPVPGR